NRLTCSEYENAQSAYSYLSHEANAAPQNADVKNALTATGPPANNRHLELDRVIFDRLLYHVSTLAAFVTIDDILLSVLVKLANIHGQRSVIFFEEDIHSLRTTLPFSLLIVLISKIHSHLNFHVIVITCQCRMPHLVPA